MCGRYALYGPRKRTRAETEYFAELDRFPPKWNVAPTETMPIVRVRDGAGFHDRMPVVLDESDYGRWLAGDDGLLKAPHNETLINYPVSRAVNSVKNDGADLVEPLDEREGQRLTP